MFMLNGLNDIPGYRYLGRKASIHYTSCAKAMHVAFALLLSPCSVSEQASVDETLSWRVSAFTKSFDLLL